jgi:hypothetical protein
MVYKQANTDPLSGRGRFGGWRVIGAALAAMLQTSNLASADGPPKLDAGPSCEAAGAGAVVAGRNKDACLADERVARDDLAKDWSKYSAADKTLCVGMNRTGGPSSYVELQSCLNIMRDSKIISKTNVLAEPLVNKGQLNTRTLAPTDLDEGNLSDGGSKKARRGQKRNDRQ